MKSAKKMIRKIARRTARNKDRVSRMRSAIKKVETAIEAKDKKQAASAMQDAQTEIMRSGHKGLIHARAASRKVSRLTRKVNAIS